MTSFTRLGAAVVATLSIAFAASNLGGAKSALEPAAAPVPSADSSPARFTAKGEMLRPTDYRSWYFMGAPLTPNDMNNGAAAFPEFHHVYIDPDSYEHYKWTGTFREGTVIVKELAAVGGKKAASGNGYFAGDIIGVEAMVKSKARFPDTPSNWGFFRFTDETAAAKGKLGTLKDKAPDVGAACIGCHAAGQHDRVFTQYYPTLRMARGAKHNPEND